MSEVEELRRQLERAGRQLPRLRRMVEFSSELLILLRGDLTVVDCNRAAAEALGLSRDGLHGRSLAEFVDAPTTMKRALGEELVRLTTDLRRADGTTFTAELSVQPVVGEGVFVAAGRDITERLELQARARQVERMQAVGILAAGVAHEVNNPLAYSAPSVAYVVDRLREAGAPDPEVMAALADAQHGLDRVKRIVGDLAALSRPHDPSLTASVPRAVDSALKIAGEQLRLRAVVSTDVRGVSAVRGDQAQLSQVLLNLLLNAAQAIEPGAAPSNRVEVRARDVDGGVEITVDDTGEGIAEDLLDKVFEPFFSTRGLRDGSGLGLAISRETVLAVGGDLRLESVRGQGTRARVWLPGAPT